MRISLLASAIILSAFSLNLYAAPCDSNFSSTGNFITGASFKTFADLSNVSTNSAYEGALADIAKISSWKIIQQDKSQGLIQAVQADSYKKGKTIPLDIKVEAIANGTKVSMSYETPAGVMSPQSAIKSQFCQTIEAAASATGQVSNTAATTQAEPITNEQASKTVEAKTEATGANAEFAKNGMPCVAEICLGDGIAELQKVKWDKVKKETLNKYLIEYVNKNFRGNLKASTPYLRTGFMGNTGAFDNQALANLDAVTVDCVTQSYTLLAGSYTSKAGNPTGVSIRLVPSQDNMTQKWTVVAINRRFKTQSEKQNSEVTSQLRERYGNFLSSLSVVKEGTGQVYIDSTPQLILSISLITAVERARLHPACGGAAKVNID